MKQVEHTLSSFCDLVYKSYCDELEKYKNPFDFDGVNVVAKYDEMIAIANRLIKQTPFIFHGGTIWNAEYDYYDKEYVLTIDADKKIWIEPVYNKDKDRYLYTGDCLTFVHGDCNSKYLKENKDAKFVAFELKDIDDNAVADCKECECVNKKADVELVKHEDDGDMKGFTQSFSSDNSYYSRSFYSNNDDILNKVLDLWT